MPAPKTKPPTEEGRISRKRKAPLDDNGDPVNLGTKKKKTSAVSTTKPGGQKRTFVPKPLAQAKRKLTVEIEEVPDDSTSVLSDVPRNPQNILELADGSDNDEDMPLAPSSHDGGSDEDEPEIIEDDEAELSKRSIFIAD